MEQSLVTYSLIRALYDQGRDYIDSFWPFAVQVLPADRTPMAPQTVADLVASRFDLSIPVHTTSTLLERAKGRGGLVVRKDHAYELTTAGLEYVRGMETRRSVERRLGSFVQAASEFLAQEHDIVADRAHVQVMIERVIERTQAAFSFVVEEPDVSSLSDVTSEDLAVLDFFEHLERQLPEQFETLRDLVLGSTLAGLLRRKDISDATRGFGRTVLFLDTNFLLSALELRFPVESRAALELLALLNRSTQFELRVFDFTLEEVFGLLRGFSRESAKYPDGVKIDSLFASMKSRGFTPGDVPALIAGLESDLAALGISIHQTGVVLDDVKVDPDEFGALGKYKPEQADRGRVHDLKALELVSQMRPRVARRVEDGRVFFLTEDATLSRYAFLERGHSQRETVSEVMPDRLLTNLLWLKDPATLDRVSIPTVIAMHSRDLFIDRGVWLRFFSVLTKLERDGELDPGAASLLLYDAQVHRDLAGLGVGRIGDVDDAWVLRRLEEAREDAESAKDFALRRQAAALQEEFQQSEAAAAADHAAERRRFEGRIEALERREASRTAANARWLAEAKRNVKRFSQRAVFGAKGFLLLGMLAVAVWASPRVSARWDEAEPLLWIVGTVIVVLNLLGWRFDPFSFWAGVTMKLERALMEVAVRRRDPPPPQSDPGDGDGVSTDVQAPRS